MLLKILTTISRIFLGIVFIFSGFVKAVDPLGSTYKFIDYFEAFGMASLEPIAFPLAIVLSSLEFFVGFLLISGMWSKLASWLTLLFMAYFTPLTLWLAISNPVTDCGCFGDALILTNWETFFKNVILLIPTLYLFIIRKKLADNFITPVRYIAPAFALLFVLWINIDAYRHLPFFDYRPYKIGTNIQEGMEIPDGAEQDVYEILTVYTKDGVEQSFTLNELPDSTWTWVRTDNKLIKKGYEAPIHDFTIESVDGEDRTEYYLNKQGITFMLIAYDLGRTNVEHLASISELADYVTASGHEFLGITSTLNDAESFSIDNNLHFQFYGMDEITLKTIIRANPGLVVLKDGVIISKFHANDIPKLTELQGDTFSDLLSIQQKSNNQHKQNLYLFMGLALILLFFAMEHQVRNCPFRLKS